MLYTCGFPCSRDNFYWLIGNCECNPAKIQACKGVEPMITSILVQCFPNWANKTTGSCSICWFAILPVKWLMNDCEYMNTELQTNKWIRVIVAMDILAVEFLSELFIFIWHFYEKHLSPARKSVTIVSTLSLNSYKLTP